MTTFKTTYKNFEAAAELFGNGRVESPAERSKCFFVGTLPNGVEFKVVGTLLEEDQDGIMYYCPNIDHATHVKINIDTGFHTYGKGAQALETHCQMLKVIELLS